MPKRDISITVKMSAEDQDLFNKAAATVWPGALVTKSSVILGLARMGAEAVLKSKKK